MTGPGGPPTPPAAPGSPPAVPGGPPVPPALPTERTRLAWRRSSLAVLTSCLFAIVAGLRRGTNAAALVALALIVITGISLLGLAQRRINALAAPGHPRLGPAGGWLGLGVAILAALAAVLVLAVPGP